jgi:uncharacterized protein DUF4260
MNAPAGMVVGPVRALLRVEGAAVALAAAAIAWALGPSWWLVLLVLVMPELGIAAYAFGPRVGAAAYNALHSYAGPAALAALALGAGGSVAAVAALWAVHIGFDRAVGYGPKYPSGFGDTHLGRVGRR